MNDNNRSLTQTNMDIEVARKAATFSIESMYHFIRGGPKAIEELNFFRNLIKNEPLFDRSDMPYQSRQEHLHNALLISKRLISLAKENNLDEVQFGALVEYVDILLPITLHFKAFMPVIKSQGAPKQVEKWYTAAKKCVIIGCYAQTELSHGSNVMGLNTVAIYDQASDEFIIHSPDITAAKWWIGGLGIVCTHAVVQAQLIIDGTSYGPHLFIVPIRSPIDLKPYKGITVGDIGPKAYGALSTADNGFALFNQVRIPRDNMLMRFSQVTREGKYIFPVHSKMSYGSMVKIRVDLIAEAGWKLAKAVTIATRYCTVRRQFYSTTSKNTGLESQVISYSSVQHRLMPLISVAYGLIIAGESMYQQFHQLINELETNNADMLPEVHSTSCALKSWSTRRATDGMEECRKTMGGHGFSIFSGVSDLFSTFVPANTYEGDNFVLSQQVARFLLKELGKADKNIKVATTAKYLNILTKENNDCFNFENNYVQILNPQVQVEIFGMRSARLVANLNKQLKSGRDWSDLNMECWEVNLAHAEYLILQQLISKVETLKVSSSQYGALMDTMKEITDLFCLSTLGHSSLSTFLSTSTINPLDLEGLNQQYRDTIKKIANNAIPLTDSFGFTDKELNTALGKKDGRAYEHLWETAQKNPANLIKEKSKLRKLALDILHRENKLSKL